LAAQELVTAICVSHSSRFGLLQRAIINFCEQEYPAKELMILVKETGYYDLVRAFLKDQRMKDFLNNEYTHPEDVRIKLFDFSTTLDAAVQGMAWGRGEWIACWDDDNLSHPKRFEEQLRQSYKERPSMLMESLYYFYDSDEMFITSYAQPSGAGHERCAVGSLMMHREAYPGLHGRDNNPWSNVLLHRLGLDYDLIAGRPELFMAGSNGDNWRGELHRKIGTRLPATWSRKQIAERSEDVEKWVQCYRHATDKVDVCGKDAMAVTVTGVQQWPDWLATTAPPDDWHEGLPSPQLQQRLQAEKNEQRRLQKVQEDLAKKKAEEEAKKREEEGKTEEDQKA